MGRHARIGSGYLEIDTIAWLEQRTGGTLPDLTADLQTWGTRTQATDGNGPGWADVVLRWLRHRCYASPDPTDPGADGVIAHYGTRLDAELWIARATTPDGPIAVVLVNDDLPVVYADATHDSGDWYDADSVEICCPNGHGWTWRTGRELIDSGGSWTTLTVVFGANLDAPFTICPRCQDHQLGRRPDPCDCDRTSWIVCPTCGARCDVELPER